MQALVECEGDSIDLGGDVGAVGRIMVSDTPSGDQEMYLDMKGMFSSYGHISLLMMIDWSAFQRRKWSYLSIGKISMAYKFLDNKRNNLKICFKKNKLS